MTEPSPPRPLRTTLLLAAGLSAALILGWAGFVVFAPSPSPVVAVAAPDARPASQGGQALRVLTLGDVLPADVVKQYENQQGVRVAIDIVHDDEDALRRFVDTPPDAAIVTGVELARLASETRLAVLSPARIPTAGDLHPLLVASGAAYDIGNRHSLALGWHALGIAYDAQAIRQRLGEAANEPSWRWLFDLDTAAKLADCGIVADDDVVETFAAAFVHLDRPIASQNVGDYEAAAQIWEKVRPMIAAFGAQEVQARLADGRACLALTMSDTAYRARVAARTRDASTALTFAVPREGSLARDLFLVMPATVRDSRPAETLFAFLLRPEIAAGMMARTGLISALPKGIAALPPDVRTDASLSVTRMGLTREADPGAQLRGLRTRYWNLIDAPGLAAPIQ